MVYAGLKRLLLGSAVSQKPLGMTGIVALIGALPLLYRMWKDLRQRKRIGLFPFLTAACLLAVLTGAAFTAFEIIWILSIGMLLEQYVAERARRAIREILEVSPEEAFVLVDGAEVATPASQLQVGDIMIVKQGHKIPSDGMIIQGEALVDESHITGRSQPELKKTGDWVYAGTQILQGVLDIRAEKVGEETYLHRIMHLVDESLGARAEAERRADILASRLLRLGVVSTIGTYVLTGSLSRALAVMLVMSCPCATVLAASTAITAAIANAARRRILVKGGLYLERMSGVDSACFDKTGTISAQIPQVVEIASRAPWQGPERVLELAATAESTNDHPLAKSLVEAAKCRGIVLEGQITCEVVLGRGVRARWDSETVLVGNRPFMEDEGINVSYFKGKAQRHARSGATVIYVGRNGKLQGMIAVANAVRPDAAAVLRGLREEGVDWHCLVSGDAEQVVKNMSAELGFDEYRAEVLPGEKATYIEQLEEEGRSVIMVGDGVNDALALAKASVGIAMGAGGAEAAIEAADIALAKDDLTGIVTLRLLSQRTLETIEHNFWMANATNALGILLGTLGWLPPVAAGILHVGHTLGIMLHSGSLMSWEPTKKPSGFHGPYGDRSVGFE
jgi:cation-transporting P-type ATPase C